MLGLFGYTRFLMVGALALGFALPNMARADQSIVFGTYSSDKPSAMVKQLGPSLKRIGESMGRILGEPVEVRLQVVRGYKAGVKLIADGKVDFARFGPASYVMAKRENPDLKILAMEKKRGKKQFFGIIAVHENSAIQELSQLQGKSFGFGNERSTLGRYFAQMSLMEAGIFASDLKSYEYLGRHDKVGRAVGSGLVDAGALEETTFKKLVRSGVPIRAITRMQNATRPWVARAGLDPRLFKALRQALIELDDTEALAALRFEGFLPGNDSDYNPTRRAIEENHKFFETKRQASN